MGSFDPIVEALFSLWPYTMSNLIIFCDSYMQHLEVGNNVTNVRDTAKLWSD